MDESVVSTARRKECIGKNRSNSKLDGIIIGQHSARLKRIDEGIGNKVIGIQKKKSQEIAACVSKCNFDKKWKDSKESNPC